MCAYITINQRKGILIFIKYSFGFSVSAILYVCGIDMNITLCIFKCNYLSLLIVHQCFSSQLSFWELMLHIHLLEMERSLQLLQ